MDERSARYEAAMEAARAALRAGHLEEGFAHYSAITELAEVADASGSTNYAAMTLVEHGLQLALRGLFDVGLSRISEGRSAARAAGLIDEDDVWFAEAPSWFPPPPVIAELYAVALTTGENLLDAGRADEAWAHYETVISAFNALGDPHCVVQTLFEYATHLALADRPGDAYQQLEVAEEIAHDAHLPTDHGDFDLANADVVAALGHADTALDSYQEAAIRFAEFGRPDEYARAKSSYACVGDKVLDVEDALEAHRQAIAAIRALRDPFPTMESDVATHLECIGKHQMELGNTREALDAMMEARTCYRTIGEELDAARIDLWLGMIHYRRSSPSHACTYLMAAHRTFENAGDEYQAGLAMAMLNNLPPSARFMGPELA